MNIVWVISCCFLGISALQADIFNVQPVSILEFLVNRVQAPNDHSLNRASSIYSIDKDGIAIETDALKKPGRNSDPSLSSQGEDSELEPVDADVLPETLDDSQFSQFAELCGKKRCGHCTHQCDHCASEQSTDSCQSGDTCDTQPCGEDNCCEETCEEGGNWNDWGWGGGGGLLSSGSGGGVSSGSTGFVASGSGGSGTTGSTGSTSSTATTGTTTGPGVTTGPGPTSTTGPGPTTTMVPEPSTWIILGTLASVVVYVKRKRSYSSSLKR